MDAHSCYDDEGVIDSQLADMLLQLINPKREEPYNKDWEDDPNGRQAACVAICHGVDLASRTIPRSGILGDLNYAGHGALNAYNRARRRIFTSV